MKFFDDTPLNFSTMIFGDLENRYGQEDAKAILRTLEELEGIPESEVQNFSCQDRLINVLSSMKDNMRFQTRH